MKPARGTYRYWRDGRVQSVVEPWEVTAAGGALTLRGQRIVGDTPVLDVAATYRNGACESFAVIWQPGGAGTRSVHYRQRGAQLEWAEDGGAARVTPIPADSLLFPLLRAATGALLPRLARGAGCVVVPDLRDPDSAGFLQPLQSQRHAERGREPGQFRYYGGEYGEAGADYWLDEDGFVQRYRWASPLGVWEVALER